VGQSNDDFGSTAQEALGGLQLIAIWLWWVETVPMMRCVAVAMLSMGLVAGAQENPAAKITANHAVTEADGTVRMQRVVPLPLGLSPEAKAWLSRPLTADADVPQTIEQRRAGLDRSQATHRDELLKMFPVTVKDSTVAGVPVREVVPTTIKHKDQVLICLHGGGFNADSGSYSESIPVAGLTGVRRERVVPAGTRTSVSRWRGGCDRGLQGVVEDVQAESHWHLWQQCWCWTYVGGCGEGEAVEDADACGAGAVFGTGEHRRRR
jgi:hypothetical protein